ncbi:MAG: hypothetical protein NTX45_29290 [Proteobacteria bacterium]|nr:hypothetical protein [Pseudomonadota bacterium]
MKTLKLEDRKRQGDAGAMSEAGPSKAGTPGSGVRLTNRSFGTQPLIVHAHGPLHNKPAWPRIKEAVFSLPAQSLGPVEGLTLLTCNNGHENMGLFERSAANLGIPCMVRGEGIMPWVNSRHKPRVIYDALHEIDTEYVLYADSRDAVLLGSPQRAIQHLNALDGCDLLFGGDRINWPALDRFRQFESSLPGAKESEFRFLNGGAWVGRTAFCREFFAAAMRTAPASEVPDSEQGILKALFPQYHPRVQLDYRCEILQNIGFVFIDIFDIDGY